MSTRESHEKEREEGKGAHVCLASLISCREYSKLSSKRLDTPLTLSESIGYWFHKMLCMVCRRYERQIRLITHAAERYATHVAERYATRVADRHAVSLQEEDPAAEVSSKESLSGSAKARIQAKLEKALEK